MLPPPVAKYLPHVGLFFLFLGVIFAIVAVFDYPSQKDSPSDIFDKTRAAMRFTQLSAVFTAVGGFLLLGPIH